MPRRRAALLALALVACRSEQVQAPQRPAPRVRNNHLGMSFIEVPAFRGSPMWVAAHETTQAVFARFVAVTGHVTTAEREGGAKVWRGTEGAWDPGASWRNTFPGPLRPVVLVSWHDAVAFCEWLTAHERRLGLLPAGYVYRLPYVDEWQHFARAGAHHAYAGTDAETELCRFGNVPDRSAAREGLGRPTLDCDDHVGLGTAIVGRYAPNALGLYDITGNVWEWTATMAPGDPARRQACGGSWSARLHLLHLRATYAAAADYRNPSVGFRVVLARPR